MTPLARALRQEGTPRPLASLLLCLLAALSPGCAGGARAPGPDPGGPSPAQADVPPSPTPVQITLQVSASSPLPGTSYRARLREIVSDSRCPLGVTCVWAGEVTARIDLLAGDSVARSLDLTLGGADGQAARKQIEGGTLELRSVRPYPREGDRTPPERYAADLTWTPGLR